MAVIMYFVLTHVQLGILYYSLQILKYFFVVHFYCCFFFFFF